MKTQKELHDILQKIISSAYSYELGEVGETYIIEVKPGIDINSIADYIGDTLVDAYGFTQDQLNRGTNIDTLIAKDNSSLITLFVDADANQIVIETAITEEELNESYLFEIFDKAIQKLKDNIPDEHQMEIQKLSDDLLKQYKKNFPGLTLLLSKKGEYLLYGILIPAILGKEMTKQGTKLILAKILAKAKELGYKSGEIKYGEDVKYNGQAMNGVLQTLYKAEELSDEDQAGLEAGADTKAELDPTIRKDVYAALLKINFTPDAANAAIDALEDTSGNAQTILQRVVDNMRELNKNSTQTLTGNAAKSVSSQLESFKLRLNESEIITSKDKQSIPSADTSINKNKAPAIFKLVSWQSNTINFDIGGGKYDTATAYLADKGVENYIYDPYNRTDEENELAIKKAGNHQADTVTISNVLNVIKEPEMREEVIANSVRALKPSGTTYITVYNKGGSEGEITKTDKTGRALSYQVNQPIHFYVPEVEEYYNDVRVKGALIIARSPK